MKSRFAAMIATFFGLGHVPIASGTFGSAAALGIVWLVAERTGWHPVWFGPLALALVPLAIWSSDVTAKDCDIEDPSRVVVDEIAGQWLTIAGAATLNWKSYLIAFLVFRLLDIWKPFPARRLESLPGGTGIVADDLMAGVYGAVVLWVAGWFNLY
jgi:phosphatidylglycerophosphatase A